MEMRKNREIKGKIKRNNTRNYSGSLSNLRVHKLPSHSVKDFHYDRIFITNNLTLRTPNNISIQLQDNTPPSLQQEYSPNPMMKL